MSSVKTRYLGYTQDCLTPDEQMALDSLHKGIECLRQEKGRSTYLLNVLLIAADKFVGLIIEHREKTERELKALLPKKALNTGGDE